MTAAARLTVPALVTSLETPAYQEFRLAAANRFSGFALSLRGKRFHSIEAWSGDRQVLRSAADLPSPDLAAVLPRMEGSGHCRFDFDLSVDPRTEAVELWAVSADGPSERLLSYPVSEIRARSPRTSGWAGRLQRIPLPPARLVSLTQGGEDIAAYQRAIIPSIWTLERIFEKTGVRLSELRSVLDFGCGTGRLLLSWWLEDPRRVLRGCDLNHELVRWGSEHLPSPIDIATSSLDPPLPFPSESFDVIQAISVFTHLSWARQKAWVAELTRVLTPGGILLVTLHGPVYVHLMAEESGRRAFERFGYLEGRSGPEGANPFVTFHSSGKAREVFGGLEEIAYFPRGDIDGERIPFPLAMYQDVYLLRRRV